MPNPWDIPPWPKTGSETAEEVYTAIGRALTSWEWAEQGLANIFAVLTGVLDVLPISPAVQAYGAVTSFTFHITMVEKAADFLFASDSNDELNHELRALIKECCGWSSRRNDVAHGRVTEVDRKLTPFGFFVFPSFYNTRKQKLTPSGFDPAYCYSAAQVHTFADAFDELNSKLFDFQDRLTAWRVKLTMLPSS
jgi:hypothetical protein